MLQSSVGTEALLVIDYFNYQLGLPTEEGTKTTIQPYCFSVHSKLRFKSTCVFVCMCLGPETRKGITQERGGRILGFDEEKVMGQVSPGRRKGGYAVGEGRDQP